MRDLDPPHEDRLVLDAAPEDANPRKTGLIVLGLTAMGLAVACSTNARLYTPLNPLGPADKLSHTEKSADQLHMELFEEDQFPTARTCGGCHPDHYREWSVSPHAYAQLSPVFNAMHSSIVKLTNGTFGDFCIRCHDQVGMQKGEPVFESNKYRHPSSREGITCIVCHRAPEDFGKVSGRFSVEKGDIYQGVYGAAPEGELERAINELGLNTESPHGVNLGGDRDEDIVARDSAIHGEVKRGPFLSEPGFCGVCHDVNLGNGFRLEEAFSEYKNSPAAERSESCQDCHMGRVQGKVLEEDNYLNVSIATVEGQRFKARKRTSHFFAGPDHSIVHPGLFPHLGEADLKLANMTEWLKFDHEAGWGTDEFERAVAERADGDVSEFVFEELDERTGETVTIDIWARADMRQAARAILDNQEALLAEYEEKRYEVLRNGYILDQVVIEGESVGMTLDEAGEPVYKTADRIVVNEEDLRDGLSFECLVRNGTDGHNVPTGFIAERTLYLDVTVTDPSGEVIFRSGDLDPNGDIRDHHSVYVHNGEMPADPFIFSLQSKFITRLQRGGEREQVLALNHSIDPLPFLRPAEFSTILTGRPRGARTHRVSIPPLGERWPGYEVEAERLSGKGEYTVQVKFISGMVPINLIDQIQHVGFDYDMSPREVGERIVEGRATLWDKTITVEVR